MEWNRRIIMEKERKRKVILFLSNGERVQEGTSPRDGDHQDDDDKKKQMVKVYST